MLQATTSYNVSRNVQIFNKQARQARRGAYSLAAGLAVAFAHLELPPNGARILRHILRHIITDCQGLPVASCQCLSVDSVLRKDDGRGGSD